MTGITNQSVSFFVDRTQISDGHLTESYSQASAPQDDQTQRTQDAFNTMHGNLPNNGFVATPAAASSSPSSSNQAAPESASSSEKFSVAAGETPSIDQQIAMLKDQLAALKQERALSDGKVSSLARARHANFQRAHPKVILKPRSNPNKEPNYRCETCPFEPLVGPLHRALAHVNTLEHKRSATNDKAKAIAPHVGAGAAAVAKK